MCVQEAMQQSATDPATGAIDMVRLWATLTAQTLWIRSERGVGIAERSPLVQDIIQTGFSKTARVARQQLGQELFKLIAGQHAPSKELQLGLSERSASPPKSLSWS